MKVIFLDIDGVLNSETYYRHPDWVRHRGMEGDTLERWSLMIGTDYVARLNRIIEATSAKIVISSSWRKAHPDVRDMQTMLDRRGLAGEVIGRTPKDGEVREPSILPSGEKAPMEQWWARGIEIWQWLTDHPEVASYVILDDDSDFPELEHRHVHTPWLHGLQDEHVAEAIRILETMLP